MWGNGYEGTHLLGVVLVELISADQLQVVEVVTVDPWVATTSIT